MKDILRLVVVLTAICVVAAMSLAFVYDATKAPIARSLRQEKLAAIKAVLPEYDNQPDQQVQTVVLGKDKRGRELKTDFYVATRQGRWVGTAFASPAKGFGGELLVMLGITPDNKLNKTKVLKHRETPGLGAKIVRDKFIDQFQHRLLSQGELKVKKDGGDIDAITGATISSRAVCDAVNDGLKLYNERFKAPDERVEQPE
jgi:electron transport complex protein RnfG